ncbi:MAG: LysR substrate-binding domain-containing protein, partial [Gammaproteobacteria bacterium]|nr:LysR substrate-binding domain-containing protein [Gammaproteobacteria bacterium]
PKAEALGAGLPTALLSLDKLLEDEEFDPATYEGAFRIAISPLFAEVLLPGLMEEVVKSAPGVDVQTSDVMPEFQDQLKRGDVDFVAYVVANTDSEIHAEPIKTIKPLCYMRPQHPLAGKKLNLQDLLHYPHVRLYLPGLARENSSKVDEILGQREMYRRVVLETTQFAPAVGVLARTDCLLIANAGLARNDVFGTHLLGKEVPIDLTQMFDAYGRADQTRMALLRHTRTSNSPAHQWMRRLIVKHLSDPNSIETASSWL